MRELWPVALLGLVLGTAFLAATALDALASTAQCNGAYKDPPGPGNGWFSCTSTTCDAPPSTCGALVTGQDPSGVSIWECVCYSTPHDWWYGGNQRCRTALVGPDRQNGTLTCTPVDCPGPNICVNQYSTNGAGVLSVMCKCRAPDGVILVDPDPGEEF